MTITLTGRPTTLQRGALRLPLMVYRPSGPGPFPAVLVAPGGIFTGLFEIMEWISSRLAAAGIFAVTINWRAGSPINDPDDVSAIIDWLEQQPEVDATRFGIMGGSRGAMAALRSAALEPRIRAVATFGALTDLMQYMRALAAYAPGRYAMLSQWLGGGPEERREFYETVQAISYASRIKQPVLLVHGAFDMHCPPEQSVSMQRELQRYGNAHVVIEMVPAMGHYGDVIPNSYDFDRLGQLIVPFFEQQLRRL
jgi:dipeptidyl aminopeptidase/acylaminoacyl peptidase